MRLCAFIAWLGCLPVPLAACTSDPARTAAVGLGADESWCEGCRAQPYLAGAAAAETRDCGELEVDTFGDAGESSDVALCVEERLTAMLPFSARTRRTGIDSFLNEDWLLTGDGVLYRFSTDSNVCGLGGGCTVRCGPRVVRTECIGPTLVSASRGLIRCVDGSYDRQQVLCGPPGP